MDNTDLKKARRRRAAAMGNGEIKDHLPPHSVEAEQGVIGCILISPAECLGRCIEKLKDGPATFYDVRHQTLYSELVAMYDKRATGLDIITVQQWLGDRDQLNAVGGIAYLAALPDVVPSAANLDYYLEIVIHKHTLRRIAKTCAETLGKIQDNGGDTDHVLDEVERDILEVRKTGETTERRTVKELAQTAIDTIERRFNRGMGLSGLSTGFMDLDRMTDGLHPGNMIVIAARPSKGKTSLCMNIAEHVALEEKLPVGVFTLEMTADELILRMLCGRARVNLRNINEGFFSEMDIPKLTTAAGKLHVAPLHIDDTSGLSIMQLRARARRMHQEFKIRLFVIDYLQLLHSTTPRARENRVQEIAEISGGIKALAKELKVPIVVASQLNRDVEREKGRKPRISDLRESGAIEQDADMVGLLYEPQAEDDSGEDHDGVPVNLLIAKQRNGPTGDVHFMFHKRITRYESAAKISADDIPAPLEQDLDYANRPYNDP